MLMHSLLPRYLPADGPFALRYLLGQGRLRTQWYFWCGEACLRPDGLTREASAQFVGPPGWISGDVWIEIRCRMDADSVEVQYSSIQGECQKTGPHEFSETIQDLKSAMTSQGTRERCGETHCCSLCRNRLQPGRRG